MLDVYSSAECCLVVVYVANKYTILKANNIQAGSVFEMHKVPKNVFVSFMCASFKLQITNLCLPWASIVMQKL